ncbi:MAG: NUDIX hydrolase [Stappia sp.]|uniref:NUDIX domain-containing protein n=1 Tax=Stappia sp. TaxID=1870903 RepID=UPI000C3DAAAD|nr:NUDIX hydrolase [Stappia sp.]MAB00204.1 NUDIX hydrolase [Stappia sp.]MBM21070.1 NUDIX hydrolase [Stappia sp.]
MTKSSRSARVIAHRVLYQGFGAYEEMDVEQERGNGDTFRISREYQIRSDVVAVLPFDPVRKCVRLARQLRVPLMARGDQDGFLIEVPAGHIDEGETPEESARREAFEEVGVRLARLDPVGEVFVSPGAITERLSLFLAEFGEEDVHEGEGGGLDHEGEDIEILEMPLVGLEEALSRDGGIDAKTLLLLQALRLKRPELFC